jgi:hypothetical protein
MCERCGELEKKLESADLRIKRLEEAVGMMLKLYDETDWYNDTVADECRRAQAGKEG